MYKETIFDKNCTADYDLSIRIAADGFSFCVYLPKEKLYLAWEHIPFEIEDNNQHRAKALALCHPMLQYSYNKVNIVVCNSCFTLVPDNVFDKNDLSQIFFFNQASISSERAIVLNQKIDILPILNLFSIPIESYDFWLEYFPNANFYHNTTPLTAQLVKYSKTNEKQAVLVNVSNTNVQIGYAEKNKLHIVQSYEVASVTDILYMCANIFEQFELSQQHTTILLTGTYGKEQPELLELISTHFGSIESLALPETFEYDNSFKHCSPFITELALLPLCV